MSSDIIIFKDTFMERLELSINTLNNEITKFSSDKEVKEILEKHKQKFTDLQSAIILDNDFTDEMYQNLLHFARYYEVFTSGITSKTYTDIKMKRNKDFTLPKFLIKETKKKISFDISDYTPPLTTPPPISTPPSPISTPPSPISTPPPTPPPPSPTPKILYDYSDCSNIKESSIAPFDDIVDPPTTYKRFVLMNGITEFTYKHKLTASGPDEIEVFQRNDKTFEINEFSLDKTALNKYKFLKQNVNLTEFLHNFIDPSRFP